MTFDDIYRCEDCSFTARESRFPAITGHLIDRFSVGSIFTDSECPCCGACAYPISVKDDAGAVDVEGVPEILNVNGDAVGSWKNIHPFKDWMDVDGAYLLPVAGFLKRGAKATIEEKVAELLPVGIKLRGRTPRFLDEIELVSGDEVLALAEIELTEAECAQLCSSMQ